MNYFKMIRKLLFLERAIGRHGQINSLSQTNESPEEQLEEAEEETRWWNRRMYKRTSAKVHFSPMH